MLTVETERYAITFECGSMTGLRNLLTGETYAAPRGDLESRLKATPHGLGVWPAGITDADRGLLQQTHQWEGNYAGLIRRTGEFPLVHRPPVRHPKWSSEVKLKRLAATRAVVTWKGLAAGEAVFPDEALTLDLEVLPGNGALSVKATAEAGRSDHGGGVYGVGFGMMNFSPDLDFAIPLFQGCHFRPRDTGPFRNVAHWPNPFVASLVVAEGETGSLALWMADPELGDRYVHLHNNKETFEVTFESVNPAPFAQHTRAESRPIRINVFRGSWVTAARPFRDWWERTFEVKRLEEKEPGWLKDCRWMASFGRFLPPEDIAPQCIYYGPQSWKVGPKIGDGGLFPYEIEKGPVLNRLTEETIRKLRERGSHVLVYLNINHMNEGHPGAGRFWGHRLVRPFGKSEIERDPKFGSPQSFLVHSAYRPWQDLQLDWAGSISERFGIVGYYMDCASGAPNHAGGRVRGMNDCRGQVELMRRVKEGIPDSFLSVEYLGEVTGQITDLAYLGFDGWFGGNDPQRGDALFRGWHWRDVHVHPIVGFLFNPYVLITTHGRGLASASFDEVMGRIPKNDSVAPALPEGSIADYSLVTPFREFFMRLLCSTMMRPVYPEAWGEGVRAYYEDRQGNTYRVESEILPESRMIRRRPGGEEELVYWRIKGRRRALLPPGRGIEGWIAYEGDTAIALVPRKQYLYYAGPRIRDWEVTRLPDGVMIDAARPYKSGMLVLEFATADGRPRSGPIELVTVHEIATAVGTGEQKTLLQLGEALGREGGRRRFRASLTAPGAIAFATREATEDVPDPTGDGLVLDLSQRPPRHFAFLSDDGIREPIMKRDMPAHDERRRRLSLRPNHTNPGFIDYVFRMPRAPAGKKLTFSFVSSVPPHTNNSYQMSVTVNGETVLNELRKGGTGEKEHSVDVTAFGGKEVLFTLGVHNHMLFQRVFLTRPVIRIQ